MNNTIYFKNGDTWIMQTTSESGFITHQPVAKQDMFYPGFSDPEHRIPWALFRQIIAFMDWGYRTHQSEVLVVLFVNDDHEWRAAVPPQIMLGASIERNTKHPEYDRLRKEMRGFEDFGSVHHHLSGAPNPSAQDIKDETARGSGYHITIGNLSEAGKECNRIFNCRIWTRKHMTEAPLCVLVKPDETVGKSDANMLIAASKFNFTEFPEEWKSRCSKPVTEGWENPFAGRVVQRDFSETLTRTSQIGSAISADTDSEGREEAEIWEVRDVITYLETFYSEEDDRVVFMILNHLRENFFPTSTVTKDRLLDIEGCMELFGSEVAGLEEIVEDLEQHMQYNKDARTAPPRPHAKIAKLFSGIQAFYGAACPPVELVGLMNKCLGEFRWAKKLTDKENMINFLFLVKRTDPERFERYSHLLDYAD